MGNQKKKQQTSSTSSAPDAPLISGSQQKKTDRSVVKERSRSQATSSPAAPSSSSQPEASKPNSTADTDASCSSEATTDHAHPSPDALIAFAMSSEWDRVESLGEIVAHADPFELRLLSSCVEGAVRASCVSLKANEIRANRPDVIDKLLHGGKMNYPDTIEHAFMLLSLLESTNRGAAFSFVRLIDKMMMDRHVQLPLLPEHIQPKALQKLGKLVSAALYHPAFSVDQQIRLANARDDLRNQMEATILLSTKEASSSTTEAPKPLHQISYVDTFKATANGDDFTIELVWNDGMCTWVHRSRDDIASLHERLLELFGEERRQETATATPSSKQNQPSSRLLPHFNPGGSPSDFIHYINSLSDLPARIVLSAPIFEEFHASRHQGASGTREFWQRMSSPPPAGRRLSTTSTQSLNANAQPLCYLPKGAPTKMNRPTCSNCAGTHPFVQCTLPNILEASVDRRQDELSTAIRNHNDWNNPRAAPHLRPHAPQPQQPPQQQFVPVAQPYPMVHHANPNQMFYPVMQYVMPHNRGNINR